MATPLSVVILAAGRGTRMHSSIPKVLHPLAGRPMISHVIEQGRSLDAHAIYLIHGHQGEQLKSALEGENIHWCHQAQQQGTAHAVMQALPDIPDHHRVLVLSGDVPSLTSQTLNELVASTPATHVGILTASVKDPKGLGRVVRNVNKQVLRIVEHKDADEATRQISEIYSGIMVAPAQLLKEWIPTLSKDNAQGEYYLTDIVHKAALSHQLSAYRTPTPDEVLGVNDKSQLSRVERLYQQRLALGLMKQGVAICDGDRVDIRGNTTFGQDVSVDVNVIFEGTNNIGNGVQIGASCYLKNVTIGDSVTILPFTHMENVVLEDGASVGPYARLRPGAHLKAGAKVGNFVEVKNATFGPNSKASHLSYVGDAEVGAGANIGAGTITCNYDGANKHQTTIEKDVFVGSNTALVAPVHIGEGATIGAGSTITKDIPAKALGLTRASQKIISNYLRPQKEKV